MPPAAGLRTRGRFWMSHRLVTITLPIGATVALHTCLNRQCPSVENPTLKKQTEITVTKMLRR